MFAAGWVLGPLLPLVRLLRLSYYRRVGGGSLKSRGGQAVRVVAEVRMQALFSALLLYHLCAQRAGAAHSRGLTKIIIKTATALDG